MSDKNLRLQVVLNAVDKLTRPFKNAQAGSKELASALKVSRDSLKSLNEQAGKIDGFRKTRTQLAITEKNLASAKKEASELSFQFASNTREMAQNIKRFEQAKARASQLQQTYNGLRMSVQRQREALKAAGIDTKQLSSAQRRLKTDAKAATDVIERQQAALRKLGERQQKLNAIRAKAEKIYDLRNKLAGNGTGMVATGVATGATLMVPVRAYSESENAANQLAGSMMGPGGKVAPEFEKINKLAIALGDKLPGTTADFQNMMTMLRRQGMSAQVILGGLGESAAYLGVQLQMAPTDAAEFAAKLQDATQTTEKDMMSLMDLIQRGFYAGVDPGNMLQGFSKISSAMSILNKKGIDAAKTFAPLLIMADQASMAGESAGNAYRKIFQAALDAKKIKAVNDDLKGTGIKFNFSDGKGGFGGLEKMYAQLSKLNKLTPERQMAIKKDLFGNDSETQQALDIMIQKGIDGYRETVAKLENQATLRERVEASLNTLGNKWEAAGGSFTNAMASIGETVAPVLKNIADWLGNLASALDGFVKRHPQLTAALFKVAAVFAIVATAAGVLSLALASILGPMAVVRVSAGILGIKFASAFGLIKQVIAGAGQAILWLGRLMMANPILAIIGLIAMGAIYIWQNWETLGPKFKAMWDAISSGVSGAWAVIKQTISSKWDEILSDVAALTAKFKAVGRAIIDGILNGINEKWEMLKSKLASVKNYLPDWMTGGDKSAGPTRQNSSGGSFAGVYDSGGYIPRGQVGIAGENGPELINGPAYVTSRRRTAALASVVAGMMGGAMPAEAAPLHPMSLPAASYRPVAEKQAGGQPVIHIESNPQFIIQALPGQSSQEIAKEVARLFAEHERRLRAKARSNFSDQGGYDS